MALRKSWTGYLGYSLLSRPPNIQTTKDETKQDSGGSVLLILYSKYSKHVKKELWTVALPKRNWLWLAHLGLDSCSSVFFSLTSAAVQFLSFAFLCCFYSQTKQTIRLLEFSVCCVYFHIHRNFSLLDWNFNEWWLIFCECLYRIGAQVTIQPSLAYLLQTCIQPKWMFSLVYLFWN